MSAATSVGVAATRWFRVRDMHSGGDAKTQWKYAYVEATDEAEARTHFGEATGVDPYGQSCDCCGPDFSFREDDSLAQASAFERGCRHDDGQCHNTGEPCPCVSLDEHLRRDDVLVVRATEATS